MLQKGGRQTQDLQIVTNDYLQLQCAALEHSDFASLY